MMAGCSFKSMEIPNHDTTSIDWANCRMTIILAFFQEPKLRGVLCNVILWMANHSEEHPHIFVITYTQWIRDIKFLRCLLMGHVDMARKLTFLSDYDGTLNHQ